VADTHHRGREPLPEPGRQGGNMPNLPPTPHAEHDLLLVAAHAAGDLDETQRSSAEALLARCSDCRQLAADLRAIAAATAALPAAARTRDFTLRPQDAARLRPRGWRRLAAALGPSRLELLRPVAPALMTLGLVGLLVSGLPLIQGSTGSYYASGSGSPAAASAPATAAPEKAAAAASAGPSGGPSSDSFGSAVKGNPAPSTRGVTPASGGALVGLQPSPSGVSDVAGEGAGAATPTAPPEFLTATRAPAAAPEPDFRLAAISAAALLLGLGLFGLRRALRSPGN
jgi:hypothetical protein